MAMASTTAAESTVSNWDAPEALSFELVTDPSRLEGLKGAWRALLGASARAEPMQDAPWLFSWWGRYAADRRLAVGLFRRNETLVGIAPLCRRTYHYRPGIPFRRLEFMGAGFDEGDGVCSEYLGLIAAIGEETAVAEAFMARLFAGGFGAFDECLFEMMEAEAPAIAALRASLDAKLAERGAGRRYRLFSSQQPAYQMPLPADWDAYLASVHGKRRNWFRRTMKDFYAWAESRGGYQIEEAVCPTSLERGMTILADLHEERWADAGEAGAFASARFAAFHRQFASRMLAEGRLDLKWLMVGGEAVAAVYNFAGRDKLYSYQSGRKMNTPNSIRLGVVMHVLAIQEAMARGCKEYDFMAGEADHKRRFGSEERLLVDLRLARRGAPEALRAALKGGRDILRKGVRRARALLIS